MLAVVSVLSTSLVAVPALSRVEPARTSGPGAGAMTTFALTPRARLHVTITVRAPARRAAASPPRTSGVTPRADTPPTTSPARARPHGAGARIRVVLGPLARAEDGGAAAGHDPLHAARRRAERRRALRGLEHTEPAAGAGADEDQPAAGGEGGDDQIDGGGDLTRDAPDRAHGARVLAIHQRGDAAGVEKVQARGRAVGALGGEPLIAEAARHGAHGITGCATIGSVPAVLTGLDVLLRDHLSSLRGRAIGLLSHQASVNRRLEHAATLLADARGVGLARLFAPEHGIWGAPQDHATIANERDPVTGLPAISLYGATREPTPPMLAGPDALVVDLQDVGSRYYTFQWTLALAMGACARAGVAVVVLDRPNPLGGAGVEGNVPDPTVASFVGP